MTAEQYDPSVDENRTCIIQIGPSSARLAGVSGGARAGFGGFSTTAAGGCMSTPLLGPLEDADAGSITSTSALASFCFSRCGAGTGGRGDGTGGMSSGDGGSDFPSTSMAARAACGGGCRCGCWGDRARAGGDGVCSDAINARTAASSSAGVGTWMSSARVAAAVAAGGAPACVGVSVASKSVAGVVAVLSTVDLHMHGLNKTQTTYEAGLEDQAAPPAPRKDGLQAALRYDVHDAHDVGQGGRRAAPQPSSGSLYADAA